MPPGYLQPNRSVSPKLEGTFARVITQDRISSLEGAIEFIFAMNCVRFMRLVCHHSLTSVAISCRSQPSYRKGSVNPFGRCARYTSRHDSRRVEVRKVRHPMLKGRLCLQALDRGQVRSISDRRLLF